MLTLVLETDQILRRPVAESFNFSDPCTDPEELARFMLKFMLEHNGIGLAAPQIGLEYKVFVMGDNSTSHVCFNPEIIEVSEDTEKYEEGCLSFPGLYVKIDRPRMVTVEFQTVNGELRRETFNGLWARCFQHELDHLNGVVFTSRAGKTALSLARSKRKNHLRRMAK